MSLNTSTELILPRVKLTATNNGNHIYIDTEVKTKRPEEYVTTVRNAYKTGKTLDINFRLQQLKNLKKMIDENINAIHEALLIDLRKPKMEVTILEMNLLINELNVFIKNLKKWMKPEHPSKPFANFFDGVEIRKEPYGVVLIISAWNYPFQLTLIPLAGAIACGNCVVVKPSELSVASTKLLIELLPHYLDTDCYQIMEGGVAETSALLENRFDYIFFTGSPKVGKIVHQAASKYLTPTTLELGGKNPVYIDATADLEKTTKRILWGKFVNAGQTCIAPDYVLCSKEIQEKFVAYAKKILTDWYGSVPKSSPDYCRVINESHFKRLTSYIETNNVAIGGNFDKEDRFIEPTILTDVSMNNAIMQDEIFGPILPIITVDSIYAAIDIISTYEKPLAVYVFSNKKKDVQFFLNNTASGGVTVNDTLMHIACATLPFGGMGNSGMGAYRFKYTIDTFTHQRSVLYKNFCPLVDKLVSRRYPPYKDINEKIINQLMAHRELISCKTLFLVVVFVVLIALLIYAFVR